MVGAANRTNLTDTKNAANSQTYGHDERDRLTSWTLNGMTQSYGYTTIGNLTSKAGTTYTYPLRSLRLRKWRHPLRGPQS